MKKKIKKYDSDFFSNAKKVVGEKRYKNAIKKGNERSREIRFKMARE